MKADEIDHDQMHADFEAMWAASEDSPAYRLAQRCSRRAREIVWEHDDKHGPVKESVKLQDAIAEELSVVAMTAITTIGPWRPIVTAPKDATRVLLRNGALAVTAWWYSGDHKWWVDEVEGHHDGYQVDATWPTHWMALAT